MSLLKERTVLNNTRYGPGIWSLQGIYGVDDSGRRGAGTTPEEAIDNAIEASKLDDPRERREHWNKTFKTLHQIVSDTPSNLSEDNNK